MSQTMFQIAIEKLIPTHINLLKTLGVKHPGDYYHIDHYRKTIMLFYPLKRNLIYPVVFHISEREYYTPPSKVYDNKRESGHFYSMCNAFFKHVRKRGVKVKERFIRDRTFFLICKSYTKSIRGGQKKTFSGISIRVHVIKWFKDIFDALKKAWNVVYNYLSKRLRGLDYSVKKPFGHVKDFRDSLSIICDFIKFEIM